LRFHGLRRPLVLLALAGVLGGALTGAPAAAAQTSLPPAPGRWVTDDAGFLSPSTVERLDARLEDYERRTGHQVLVWIGRTIGENAVLEDWAARTFEAWKVGRKGIDDGLVLFILAQDRKIKIEVGYGLEDKVPDIYAYRVINNVLAPGILAGRPDEAVEAAVTALIGYISGDEAPSGGAARAPRPESSIAGKIFTVIIVLLLLVLFITNPSLALWLLVSILSGGRGGGGGGGGFSGGGGRSGGGGASGGW
jgi:uncharacterized protein